MPTRPAQSHSHFRSIWTRIHETIKRLSWISSDQLTPKQRRRLQLLLMTWQIQRPSFCLSRAVVCHPHLVVSVSCKLITRSQIIQSRQKQWWHLHPNEKHTDTSAYLQPTIPVHHQHYLLVHPNYNDRGGCCVDVWTRLLIWDLHLSLSVCHLLVIQINDQVCFWPP